MTSDGGRRAALGPVLTVADRQHGVVLTRQLLGAGFSYKVISRMRDEDLLHPVLPGAYVVGTASPTPWQRAVAAVQVVGAGSALSHGTAGRIHRLPLLAFGPGVELSVDASRRPRMAGVVAHRVASLDAADTVEHRGVAVTSPARTLVDLSPGLGRELLARLIDEGAVARLWTPADLGSALERMGHRAGLGTLRGLLVGRAAESVPESVLEMRVVHALRSLRPFEVQHQVVLDGRVFVLDLAWPHLKLAVECDGWEVRSRSRRKFDHDRRRGNLLAAHGWVVVHVTAAMSDEEMLTAVLQVVMSRGGHA